MQFSAQMAGLLAATILMNSMVFAQEAFIGKWKGEATDDEGMVYLLSFEVPFANNSLIMGELESPAEGMMSVLLNDFMMDGDAIKFALHIDERFDCTVKPDMDIPSYAGSCRNQEGQGATIVLERVALTGNKTDSIPTVPF